MLKRIAAGKKVEFWSKEKTLELCSDYMEMTQYSDNEHFCFIIL